MLAIARAYDHTHWQEHLHKVFPQLLVELQQLDDVTLQALALRVLRELLKNPSTHPDAAPFTSSLTNAVIKAYSSSDLNISQLAEDLFGVLASALPAQTMVEILTPLVSNESDNTLLAAIKLLTKVTQLHCLTTPITTPTTAGSPRC